MQKNLDQKVSSVKKRGAYIDYLEENCETSKDQYPKTEKDLKNLCVHLNGINCNHHLLKLMAQENNIQRLRDMAEIKC